MLLFVMGNSRNLIVASSRVTTRHIGDRKLVSIQWHNSRTCWGTGYSVQKPAPYGVLILH